jgi:hypothetical protein
MARKTRSRGKSKTNRRRRNRTIRRRRKSGGGGYINNAFFTPYLDDDGLYPELNLYGVYRFYLNGGTGDHVLVQDNQHTIVGSFTAPQGFLPGNYKITAIQNFNRNTYTANIFAVQV